MDVESNGWDENKEKERLYKNENDGMELSLKEFHQREPCNGRLFSAISGSKAMLREKVHIAYHYGHIFSVEDLQWGLNTWFAQVPIILPWEILQHLD